ncbi:MAG: PH domain-containing protein [Micromonosporaceae bacterium]
MPDSRTVRFRHNIAIPLTGLAATIALVPLAGNLWYLSPLLLAGVLATAWGFRAGVDVDSGGLTVRALFGNRRLPWGEITGFGIDGRRVYAVLPGDRTLPLPAVTAEDVPRLIEAGGQHLQEPDQQDQQEPDQPGPEPDQQDQPHSEPGQQEREDQ